MKAELDEVELITDGACSGNPGPGGWAALLRFRGVERWLSGAEADTTNNRMELSAALFGLRALKRRSRVLLTTDSQYLIKGIEEWMPGWKRKGWRNAAGAAVANRDLWEALDEAVKAHEVRFKWVRGHAGHADNEAVDARARAAIATVRR